MCMSTLLYGSMSSCTDLNPWMASKVTTTNQLLNFLCGFAVRGYGSQTRLKFIIGRDEAVHTECCHELLNNLDIQHPLASIVLDCVSTFHEKYGCGVRSLLCLILAWYRVYIRLLDQNIPTAEISHTLDDIFELIIKHVNSKAISITTNLFPLTAPLTSPLTYTSGSVNDQGFGIIEPVKPQTNSDISVTKTVSEQKIQSQGRKWDNLTAGRGKESKTDQRVLDDDVSWYFLPTDNNLDIKLAESLKATVIVGDHNISKGQSSQIHKRPAAAAAATVTVHSDDEDFADCFDDIELSSPAEIVSHQLSSDNKTDKIDWLNEALNSLSSNTVTKKLTIISRHSMQLEDTSNYELPESFKPDYTSNPSPSQSYKPDYASVGNSHHSDKHEPELTAPLSPHSTDNLSTVEPLDDRFSHSDYMTVIPPDITVSDLTAALARDDPLITDLLHQIISKLRASDNLTSKSLSDITVVSCVGPLSANSCILDGIVLRCTEATSQLLTDHSCSVRSVMFQGDLTSEFTHTGYKEAVKHHRVINSSDYLLTHPRHGETRQGDVRHTDSNWCDTAYKTLIQSGIECVLMTGYCDRILKYNLECRGRVVLENIPHSVLTHITHLTSCPILHYIHDVHERFTSKLTISRSELSCTSRKSSSLIRLSIPCSVADIQQSKVTVVICSPVRYECEILSERFNHSLSRLLSIISSQKCLINLPLYNLSSQLINTTHSTEANNDLFSEAIYYLSEELSSLSPPPDTLCSSLSVDPVETFISAWENSLSLVKYISTISLYVKTGSVNS